MLIETQPTKNPKLRQERHLNIPLLTEFGWFGNGETINMAALMAFAWRLGGLALKEVHDLPYRRPSYQA